MYDFLPTLPSILNNDISTESTPDTVVADDIISE